MTPADAYVIRLAGDFDEPELARLAEIDSAAPLEHPILLGEIGGRPAAAIDLDTGRAIADPFVATAGLQAHLRLRAGAYDAHARAPGLAERVRAAMSRTRVVPA